MNRSGHADLPLHYGHVPKWLAERMTALGGAIVEAIVMDYGKSAVLQRLSDPCWFQALGCVMGMDWHSSGITTSVMGALKRAINPMSGALGIYVCGGRGTHSRKTPEELLRLGDRNGIDGKAMVHHSRLAAKVDNTAIQDGFQLYLHNFIVTDEGEWAVVQQGMNEQSRMARRYHWHAPMVRSFVDAPHAGIYGPNQGMIMNLVHQQADVTRNSIVNMVQRDPSQILPVYRELVMPDHHEVRAKDVQLKRLGAVLALAYERPPEDFESLLLLEGVGPRTLQSLTLVSEVIHGTPSRFTDPARFSFAHGGKDGHPFPVPVNVYDETIGILKGAVYKAKIGQQDKHDAIRKLSDFAASLEKDFEPNNQFDEWVQHERDTSYLYGGRTVMGKAKAPVKEDVQLKLF
ncbi:DUF763 domain-containing protein [uncultured Chitinophaga sp.]|uniref:DUF763 domain-containing protein n=1 Tax=uncultured Chitinophaga sp. TaxID=339340 RepID=UPI0025EBF34A|nr:DUF763 domain-containing protein [uncultured Chitinophaga sp.]